MRLVTWNCRIGGFRTKSKHVAPLRADVLAVQEVEPLDKVKEFAGDAQPTFRDRVADPAFPKRAIGLFSYTDTKLKSVDANDMLYSFRRYEADRGSLAFNVVAVWPWETKSAETSYRQAHDGLIRHADWIRQRPTVVLGDFNANASFKGRHRKNWQDLAALMEGLGLVSAYHQKHGEAFGGESRHTHFHKGAADRSFHLDYCFVPTAWSPKIKNADVGTHAEWGAVSDHAPLIVDLAL